MTKENLGQILVERRKPDSCFGDFNTFKELATFNFRKARGSNCIAGLVIVIQPLVRLLPKLSEKEADDFLVIMNSVSCPHTSVSILNDFLEKWPDNLLADAIGSVARRFIELYY